MKKRVLALVMAVLCLVMGSFMAETDVRAEEVGQEIDITYLLEDPNTLIGTVDLQMWGVYLKNGNSLLNNLGDGTIACGGITYANVACRVSVTVILERNVDGSWLCVTSWTESNENATIAMTSKNVIVGGNYWYRVRCTHSANSDVANSYTDALWI